MFGRRRRKNRPYYLVSSAGLPNYGDEILARVWLDWLAVHRPHTPVWLDCPEPGRANHLFAGAHPLLKTTNTLWHLAFGSQGLGLSEGAERASRFVTGLGSPRFDLGLLELRDVQSVHLLGGGYLNSVWENHLFMLPALTALKETFQVPLYATGQGVLPLSAEAQTAVAGWVEQFDIFETRDRWSAEAVGALNGIDDAFLAFANSRQLYSSSEAPEVMLLLQGDFVAKDDQAALIDIAEKFVREHGQGAKVGLVEAIPPDDSWALDRLRERGIDVEFYPFSRLWLEGLPAKPGQRWLSTRFHFHLLAAAAGAKGAVIELGSDYYGVKHGSLRELGTGWSHASSLDVEGELTPTVDESFAEKIITLAERKAALARRIYAS